MGRVQTPTLGFIMERELLREKHIPIVYNSVNFYSNETNFKIRFHEKNDPEAWLDDSGKHFPDRTFNQDLAAEAITRLKDNKKIEIESVKEGKNKRNPKPPFTTDTMLQSASSNLGWSVARTSSVAGELYNSGHVTYIRTDSTRTNEDARKTIKDHVREKFGEDHLGPGVLGPDAKKGTTNVQDAHEAIRPTDPRLLEPTDLENDAIKLYRLIRSRFLSSQMSDSIRERREIIASVDGTGLQVSGTASWRIHPGWESASSEFLAKPRIEEPQYALSDCLLYTSPSPRDRG